MVKYNCLEIQWVPYKNTDNPYEINGTLGRKQITGKETVHSQWTSDVSSSDHQYLHSTCKLQY